MTLHIFCADAECRQTIEEFLVTLPPSASECVVADMEDVAAKKIALPGRCDILLRLENGNTEVSDLPTAARLSLTLKKPFRLQQLETLLGEAQHRLAQHRPVLLSPTVEFHAAERTLRRADTGIEARLTEKEAKLLGLLADGKPVARETLLAEAWGYRAKVTTNTLETHIWRLKQKLESLYPNGAPPFEIQSENGGYRLIFFV